MSEKRLEIDVLGPLQLRVGGTPVDVPGPRRRAVLALLAVSAPDVGRLDIRAAPGRFLAGGMPGAVAAGVGETWR